MFETVLELFVVVMRVPALRGLFCILVVLAALEQVCGHKAPYVPAPAQVATLPSPARAHAQPHEAKPQGKLPAK